MIPDDLDGEEHQFFRRILNPFFMPKVIAEYAAGVRADVDRIVQDARSRGRIDIATEIGQPVTGMVTMRILGLPVEDWALYSIPIHNAAFSIGPVETRIADGQAFGARVKAEVARIASMPDAPGLIGHLARASANDRQLTLDEIERIVINLIIGGLDTTQATLSCSAVYLGRHPERLRELAEDPDRIPAAVDEFLRVFNSAPMTGRYNRMDIEVDGHRFAGGETTLLFWTAGNFDPAFVESPFDLDFTRARKRSVTFAMGPHRCLGVHLAKMELVAFITALVQQLPEFSLIEDEVEIAQDIAATLAYLHVPARVGAYRHVIAPLS